MIQVAPTIPEVALHVLTANWQKGKSLLTECRSSIKSSPRRSPIIRPVQMMVVRVAVQVVQLVQRVVHVVVVVTIIIIVEQRMRSTVAEDGTRVGPAERQVSVAEVFQSNHVQRGGGVAPRWRIRSLARHEVGECHLTGAAQLVLHPVGLRH